MCIRDSLQPAEKRTVAGGAVGHALPGKSLFAGAAQLAGRGAGGQNHCPGLILAGRAGQGLYLSLQLQRTDFIRLSLSAKRLCLLHHTGREGCLLYTSREDGYHEMEMLMHAVSLENTVRLTTLDRPGIRLNCSNPAVPTGEKNLAYRAAQAFFAAWGHAVGLEIQVEKRVPMEAGMAGGSADAAGVLVGLCLLYTS